MKHDPDTLDIQILTVSNRYVARLKRVEQVERNRETLLDAAWRVFVDRGYAGASLEAIADKAGFSKGVVYSQFGSKPDLFFAMLERRIDRRNAQNARVAMEYAGREGLDELISTAARDTAEEPGWQHVLIEFRALAMRDPELNERYRRAHARTVDGIASALQRLYDGVAVAPPAPVRALAEFVIASAAGIALERAADPDAIPDDHVRPLLSRMLGFDVDVPVTR